MSVTAGLGLLLGLALGVEGPTLQAGLSAEARSRDLHPAGAPWQHTAALAAAPRLALRADGPGVRLLAAYALRLSAADVRVSDRVDVLNEARLEARSAPPGGLAWTAAVTGTLGTASLLQEARRADAAAAPFTTVSVVRRRALGATAGLTAPLDARTSTDVAVGWSAGGGTDAESRRLMPSEQALRLDAALRWRATRLDEAGLALGAAESRLTGGSLARFGLTSVTWRHRLEARLELHAAAGAGASYTENPARPAALKPAFLGELGVVQSVSAPAVASRLVLRATPAVDRLRGTVDPRLEAEATAALSFGEGWRLAGRGSAARVRREPGDVRLFLVDLRVERTVARGLWAGLGAYTAWQRTAAADLPSFFEAGGAVSLAWDSPRVELRP